MKNAGLVDAFPNILGAQTMLLPSPPQGRLLTEPSRTFPVNGDSVNEIPLCFRETFARQLLIPIQLSENIPHIPGRTA